jgi:restriction system protein
VPQPARRRNRWKLPAAIAAVVAIVLQLTLHAVSALWPFWLAAVVLVLFGGWLSQRVTEGRGAATAEEVRREAIADAERHRELAALDRMPGSVFEIHIANLCRRDGLAVERAGGGAGDLGADVIATTPDGRRVVIQCKRYQPHAAVSGPDMQRFLGTVHAVHNADVAVVVTTAQRFTRQAQELAVSRGVILINRDRLALWNSGSSLIPFLDMPPVGSGVRIVPPDRRRQSGS